MESSILSTHVCCCGCATLRSDPEFTDQTEKEDSLTDALGLTEDSYCVSIPEPPPGMQVTRLPQTTRNYHKSRLWRLTGNESWSVNLWRDKTLGHASRHLHFGSKLSRHRSRGTQIRE
ncbi:hypothetical protein E2C01_008890 [Portunus trituberculatus]|uniref:Uncharacterized protein n=1 Tax=Portunus trituberculatus TaxID=210409 RepID=A0A5B7D3K0_PORTR|nr:hypothetical protein [Portunus trituberculatus]